MRGRAPRLHRAGREFLSVLDALYGEPAISLVATRYEGGAAFMAEAAGKPTGVPALYIGMRVTDPNQIAVGTTIAGLRAPFGQDED